MFRLHGTTTRLAAPPQPPPQLAEGIELIGEYKDSGLKEAPCIVRLRGGRIVQMPQLLFTVTEAIDGTRTLEEIAAHVREELQLGITAEQIQFLLDHRLRPLGVLDGTARDGEPLEAAPLAFTMRKAFIPAGGVRPLAALLRHFFRPTLVGAALAWLVVLDFWLYFEHGLGDAVHAVLANPVLMLLVFALVVASTIFHELGHAAACRYGGARPGAIGGGLYYVWPAFFTDVTDAYRLDRRGRLRTDFGGIYFNVLFMLGVAAVYYRTHYEPLLVFIAVQHMQILNQFIPWVRLDGYYVLTDLTGVPDVLTRVKAVLKSLIPDREPEPSVAELKPWVRTALTVYVCTLIPVLAFAVMMLLVHAPRFLSVAVTSLHARGDELAVAAAHGDLGAAALAAVQFVALLLPALGMALTILRIARAVTRRVIARRRVRIAFVLAAAGFAVTAGYAAAPPAGWSPVRATTPVRTDGRYPASGTSRARVRAQRRAPATTSQTTTSRTTKDGETRTATGPRTETPGSTQQRQPYANPTSTTETVATEPVETEVTTEPEPPPATTTQPTTTAPTTTAATTTAPPTTTAVTTVAPTAATNGATTTTTTPTTTARPPTTP